MRRWLLWAFRCRRGRRCARVAVDEPEALLAAGYRFVAEYTCGNCGTRYRGNDWNREVVR